MCGTSLLVNYYVNSAILDPNSYLWGPINNSGNNGRILTFFFFKPIRISPQIHSHHSQLNPRSVEASGETASLEVNISWKFSSQIWWKVFLDSPRGPWKYVVYQFSGLDFCHSAHSGGVCWGMHQEGMHQKGSLFWQNFAWAGHFLGRSYCLQVANMSMFPLTANFLSPCRPHSLVFIPFLFKVIIVYKSSQ